MSSHYDNGFADGKNDYNACYPTTSQTDFDEYQRGFINGFMTRMQQDVQKFRSLHTYTVCLHQRAIVRARRYVNVLATSEEEAKQLAEEGEQIQKVSSLYHDDTEELLSETAVIVSPDDLAWEIELKDWA